MASYIRFFRECSAANASSITGKVMVGVLTVLFIAEKPIVPVAQGLPVVYQSDGNGRVVGDMSDRRDDRILSLWKAG